MIGYYVHHHGRGHLSRAIAIARALAEPVTILTSLPRSTEWSGPWVELPLDVDDDPPRDPQAHGRLHWAPLRSAGLRSRMAAIASWIARTRPAAVVVDVSVEVALLCRLLGVPVVTIAMPGNRQDPAHDLGYAVSTAIVAAWPAASTALTDGLPEEVRARVRPVGAISRFAAADRAGHGPERRVLVLSGSGGDDFAPALVTAAADATADWSWTHVGGSSGRWADDPWRLLRAAAVVVTHAGENAVAEVAAARRPAVIIPQTRPHQEQAATARALVQAGCPVTVLRRFPRAGWPEILAQTAQRDGEAWARWNDGEGARRAAAVIREVARDA